VQLALQSEQQPAEEQRFPIREQRLPASWALLLEL